jgi:hypothetical protein
MDYFLKILSVYFVTVLKYWFGFPAARVAGLSFLETYFITTLGGITAFFIFYFFSPVVFKFFAWLIYEFKKFLNINIEPVLKTKKNIFTKRSRLFVKVMQRYGLAGLAFVTPSLISIPVGSTIAANLSGRKAKNKLKVITLFCSSIIFWDLVLTAITFIF